MAGSDEFFYLDENGQKQDAKLHEEMLRGEHPEAEMHGMAVAERILTPEELDALFMEPHEHHLAAARKKVAERRRQAADAFNPSEPRDPAGKWTTGLFHGSHDPAPKFAATSQSVNTETSGLLGEVPTVRHGISFTDNPDFAKEYGQHVGQYKTSGEFADITPELRDEFLGTLDPHGPDRDLWVQAKYGSKKPWTLFEGDLGEKFSNFLRSKGFNGARFQEETPTSGGYVEGNTTIVLDPDSIQRVDAGSAADLPGLREAASTYHPGAKEGPDAAAAKRQWRERAPDTVEKIANVAPRNHHALIEAAKAIAAATGAGLKDPGPKSAQRIAEKVARKAAAGVAKPAQQVNDAARAGFDVSSPQQADAVVKALAEKFEVADEGWTRTAAGYFDRKAMIRFPDGMIGEVQLWPPGMLQAKAGEHEVYAAWERAAPGPEKKRMLDTMIGVFSKLCAGLTEAWRKVTSC